MMLDMSIVIATFNRRELLPRTLPALAQQTGNAAYEVIFVDDGSTDDSGKLISEAVRRWPGTFRYIREAHTGSPAHPRNVGIREARGEVILLLDDDVIPDPTLIHEHWHFHREHPDSADAALGELYLPQDVLTDPMSLFHTFPYDEVRKQKRLGYLFFWTCNVSVKRDFMLEHGLFDEDAALHPVEDMECGYRLFQRGLNLAFLTSARGQHVHKMDARWVAQKGHRTGRANFALSQKVPDRGLKERFGILSLDLPLWLLLWRTIRRGAFRMVDNTFTSWILRHLGAQRPHRSIISDAYYYLVFRRNMVAGYKSALREHRGVSAPNACKPEHEGA